MRERLRRWLGRPAAHGVAVALALVLAAPSLTSGLGADDWLHAVIARGRPPAPFAGAVPSNPLDLFSFAGHVPGSTQRFVDAGVFPWWTDPEIKLAFWRPLSSLTHWLDWHAWPRSPFLMHVQNLIWFALALWAVSAFYRRFSTAPWIAGLAMLLYALDDAHSPAVAWVANRNAMIALAIALPSVVVHDRWRNDGWRPGVWLGPLALLAGLFAGESALATLAYLGAYALCLDRRGWRKGLLALAPYAVIVVAWRLLYQKLGYGTFGSGVYLDPGSDTAAFVRLLPSRASFLLASQFALPWSDLATMYSYISPAAERLMLGIAVGTVALFAIVLAPLCRRSPVARFYAIGTLLAVVPVCSTFPADRLLFFVSIGAMGLLAEWIGQMQRKLLSIAFLVLLVLIHVVLAVPFSWLRARSTVTIARPIERANDSLPKTPDVNARTLVLVNPPSDYLVGYIDILRAARGEPIPRLRWLATGSTAVTFTRTDARTLEVRPEGGFLPSVGEHMLRQRPFPRGETIMLTDLKIDVTAVGADGRPTAATMHFDRPLEDYAFYEWRDLGYVPWTPPPAGKTVTLPRIDFLKILFTPPDQN